MDLIFSIIEVLDMLICCLCFCISVTYIPHSIVRAARYVYLRLKGGK